MKKCSTNWHLADLLSEKLIQGNRDQRQIEKLKKKQPQATA